MNGQRACDPLLESHASAGGSRKRRHPVRRKAYTRSVGAARWKVGLEEMEASGHPKRLRRTHTAVIFACIFTLGLVSAVFGSTSDDLQGIYHLTAEGVSQILVTRSAGILFGSVLCGFIYKYVNAKIVIILSLLAGGLGTAIIPDVAPHFWIAHAGIFVTGLSVGALEVGANVWLVQLWEESVNPVMQSYHVSYGIGALMSPLITTPFLGPDKNNTLNTTVNQQFENSDLNSQLPMNGTSHIAVPYGMFGGAYGFMGLVILFFFMIDRSVLRQQRPSETDDRSHRAGAGFAWTVIGLLSTYIVVCVTFESIMTNMLTLYVIRNLSMDKTEANFLLALYWATYTTGRIATIFISFELKPSTILVAAQGITSIGAGVLFLLVFPTTSGRATIWLATAIIGFGLAPLYPTAFTWAVRYIHLKYLHMSIILIASCTGGFLPTYIVAPFVESSRTAMLWVSAGCGALLILILATMLFTTMNRRPVYGEDDKRGLVPQVKEFGSKDESPSQRAEP